MAEQQSILGRVLDPPAYGFERDGRLYIPSHVEVFREFFRKLNILHSRKNWLPFFGWLTTFSFAIPLMIFLIRFFSWPVAFVGFIYGAVVLGSHGTFWLHRYSTHRAFSFRNALVREICRNLVIKIIPEETYVISHHVHHNMTEQPGDPYNVHAGWLYCFLADVNHQGIQKNLSEKDYQLLCKLMSHTGVRLNDYSRYRKWGSLCHPAWTFLHYILNWSFWYGCFFLVGGHALACALFGSAGVWAIGVRTFNYDGHGQGKDRRRDGIDFNRRDLSINQLWPGYVAGEWHNNHHLYPNGARSGFLRYQLDLPWLFIRMLSAVGAVTAYKDYQSEFLMDYYFPYLTSLALEHRITGENP